MAAEDVRLWVWCEDDKHEQFVRGLFTRRFGLDRRAFRWFKAPEGCASQWVIANFECAADKARRLSFQANLGFLVVVDGDNAGIRSRKKALFSGNQDPRESNHRLAIWVPTWSIETWVKWLCNGFAATDDVEGESCKSEVERDWRTMLETAITAWDLALQDEPRRVPSLAVARAEMSRLPLP